MSHIERNASAHQAHEDSAADYEDALEIATEEAYKNLLSRFSMAMHDPRGDTKVFVVMGSEYEPAPFMCSVPVRNEIMDLFFDDGMHGDPVFEPALLELLASDDDKAIASLKILRKKFATAYADKYAKRIAQINIDQ